MREAERAKCALHQLCTAPQAGRCGRSVAVAAGQAPSPCCSMLPRTPRPAVTDLAGRIFATWTLTSCMLCLICARNPSVPAIYGEQRQPAAATG